MRRRTNRGSTVPLLGGAIRLLYTFMIDHMKNQLTYEIVETRVLRNFFHRHTYFLHNQFIREKEISIEILCHFHQSRKVSLAAIC